MVREIKLSQKLMLGMGIVIGVFSLIAFIWNVAETRYSYQKELLEKAHINWKGNGEQIDDITVIGIRI